MTADDGEEEGQPRLARSLPGLLTVGSLLILGLVVRLHEYVLAPGLTDVPSEFSFGWAGLRMLAGKAPSGASTIAAYGGRTSDVSFIGLNFHLATPWLDAPPLWSLISGAAARLSGAASFQQLTPEALRRPSLVLSVITVPLGYALARRLMPPVAALGAGILLAVEPALVLFSRASLPEAALAPLLLMLLLLVTAPVPDSQAQGSAGVGRAPAHAPSTKTLAFASALCAAAPLLRLSGVALALAAAGILWARDLKRAAVVLAVSGAAGLVVALGFGLAVGGGLFIAVLQAQAGSGGGAGGVIRFITGANGPGRPFLDGWVIFAWVALAYLAGNAKRRHRYRAVVWPVVAYVAIAVPFLSEPDLGLEGWFILPILPLLLVGAAGALYAAVREGQLLLPGLAALTAGTWSLQWIVLGPWRPSAVVVLLLAATALVPMAIAEVQPRGRLRDAGQGIWALLGGLALAGCVVLSWNLASELGRLS